MLRNHNGFTLIEIVIASGLLAALSLGVMQTMHTMQKGQVQSETKMEEIEIRRLVTTLLADKVACQNTLVGNNIGANITSIKNAGGATLYQTGNTYGNNSIKLTNIKTVDLNQVGTDGTRVVNLVLTLQKQKKLAGSTSKDATIQLNVKAPSATGVITECFGDSQQIVENSCISIGGTWNGATCTLNNFVLKTGDTMTGALNLTSAAATGNISAAQFCSGGNCKAITDLALSNQLCPNGQVANGTKADGTPNCRALQCPANQYFAGLDISNNAICRPYPTNTCPTNEYVSQVNANGTVQCAVIPNTATSTCPVGQVLQSINAGVPTCVNKGAGTSCGAGQVVSAVAADGSVTCINKGPGTSCPAGRAITTVAANGSVTCSSISGTRGGSYRKPSACTSPNPVTGACTCPSPYTAIGIPEPACTSCYCGMVPAIGQYICM